MILQLELLLLPLLLLLHEFHQVLTRGLEAPSYDYVKYMQQKKQHQHSQQQQQHLCQFHCDHVLWTKYFSYKVFQLEVMLQQDRLDLEIKYSARGNLVS